MAANEGLAAEVERLRQRVGELETALAAARSESAGSLRSSLDRSFEGIQIIDGNWCYVYLNETAARHGRCTREELFGKRMPDMYPGIERTEVFRLMQRCMVERTPQRMLNRFTYPDGRSAWFDLRIEPVPVGILVLSVDVTEQKAAEEDLRRSREDLMTTLRCIADGVIATDTEARVLRMNPAAEALTGWSEAEAAGKPLDELVRFLNQKTQAPIEHPVQRILQNGVTIGLANDTLLVRRDGSRVPIASSGAPIREASGAIRGVVLALKNMKEEYELTAMLQHSQKMEAIGRLAGGIAHDFNNLIAVIGGYSDLVLRDLPEPSPLRDAVQQIADAGRRAAALTRQLLAFSRKQVLRLEVLDLNAVVSQMEKMLRRLIGEDVDLVTRLHPELYRVKADPGQIEQIIMNIAVNARDAMPVGGKLTIETANVELDEEYARRHPGATPGPHAMVAITDTGSGMDAETKARIFEPFFTTKVLGKGTGLGLSTVFGIIKQSGGNIWVYSEPGLGTTFKVYLPRTSESGEPSPEARPRPGAIRGTGTILVVEDEAAVRSLLRLVLGRAGYSVLVAGDIDEAVRVCSEHSGAIHLLLTDVVLPKAGGREVAARIRALRPGIAVAFMSGYADHAIAHHGVLEPGAAFLEKPFSSEALLSKVRELLP